MPKANLKDFLALCAMKFIPKGFGKSRGLIVNLGILGFVFSSLLVTTFNAYSCDVQVAQSAFPLEGKKHFVDFCLEDYFGVRDLVNWSMVETINGQSVVTKMSLDDKEIHFDDWIILEAPLKKGQALGEDGRVELVKSIYNKFFQSFKNENGQCELKIFSADKQLTLADFEQSVRTDGAPFPGSRLMLTSDHVANPKWQLWCLDKSGVPAIEKSGQYMLLFVDVYENIDSSLIGGVTGHPSKFLFSLGGKL